MIRKILGRTGLEVTQLGYGSMGIRGPKTWGVRVISEEAADEILNCVLDAGINFIDTSPQALGPPRSSTRDPPGGRVKAQPFPSS